MLDIGNLPMLNTSANIAESLMYESKRDRSKVQIWRLYNDGHFDMITNSEGFLATGYFCCRCCSCFARKSTFETHDCNSHIEGATTKKLKKVIFKEDACHDPKAGVNEGSEAELQLSLIHI